MPSLAQKFSRPRIVADKYDKWFLERLLKAKLKIPYATVTIEEFKRPTLKSIAEELMGDKLIDVATLKENYHFNFSINMPEGLDYHLNCKITDYEEEETLYFNECEGSFKYNPSLLNEDYAELDSISLLAHLHKLCRVCRPMNSRELSGLTSMEAYNALREKLLELAPDEVPPIIHFLQVQKNWSKQEKPHINYSYFYEPPSMTKAMVQTKFFLAMGDSFRYRATSEDDFYDLVHSYLNYHAQVMLAPMHNHELPQAKDEALLLEKGKAVLIVDGSQYVSEKPHCLIQEYNLAGG